mmetsp:Transcript_15873/g.21262  ORF Transcript_15873/g.21262 Transcript_15873/m.21262 type:complete len:120 (+) Transcript_15873:161-520(+)
MKGVIRTVVGYSGGQEKNPTYAYIKDSTESILIEYDPDIISYEDILVEWSRMHSPISKRKTQYRSAIFYADEEQKKIAEETVKAMKSALGVSKVFTGIEPVSAFYRAEEYHQNYLNKYR